MIFEKFTASVNQAILEDNLDLALSMLQTFVFAIVQDDSATGEVFGSKDLDLLCVQIGDRINSKRISPVSTPINGGEGILFIASHLEKLGGHSKVCIDTIRELVKTTKVNLAVTNIHQVFDPTDLKIECPIFTPKQFGGEVSTTNWLIDVVLSTNPKKIVLMNHHQDSACIAAMAPFLRSKEIIFFHHADHNLCLGLHLPNVAHIDPLNIGYFDCRYNEGISNNLFIPLAIKDRGVRSAKISNKDFNTCSSGSYGPKFGIPYKYKYFDFIIYRLLEKDGIHFHVGNIPKEELEDFKSLLAKEKISSERFVHIPYVDSLWEFIKDKSIDLYISSFPMAGARATMEVMGAGVPILMHDSSFHRYFSGKDTAYPNVFLWSTPNDFIGILNSLSFQDLMDASLSARKHYDQYHKDNLFIDYLNGGSKYLDIKPPALVEHMPDRLGTFLYKQELANENYRLLESKNIELSNALKASQEIALSWRATIVAMDRRYQRFLNIFNKASYYQRRVSTLFGIYGNPFKRGTYSYSILMDSFSLAAKLKIQEIKSLMRRELMEVSKVLSFNEKIRHDFSRRNRKNLSADILSNSRRVDIVVFDHFGGGGSNLYSDQFFTKELASKNSVLRVGFYDRNWYGLLYEPDKINLELYIFEELDILFEVMKISNLSKVVFNSVYGAPDLTSLSIAWKEFLKSSSTSLESKYIAHDFLPVCPSLHLLDYGAEYCGFPANVNKCDTCYGKLDLRPWTHNWVDIESIPKSAAGWRLQFKELIENIDEIEVFDEFAPEIFEKAYPSKIKKFSIHHVELDLHKKLRPVTRSSKLRIGILGGLSSIKGQSKVIDLANYFTNSDIGVPITVLGPSHGMPENVRMHGKYEIDQLPALVEELKINVILFPSIVPETYSYVLTEVFEMKLPVVCFDLGAQSSRVGQYPLGIVIPVDSSSKQIYEALVRAAVL